ncbi:MAG TPA: Uma2 family endonuclease [Vicinamibacterales bacterium]
MPVEVIKRRFTADDYQRMGQAGILSSEDRVELIDGDVVAMTPIGPRHSACIDRANRALVTLLGDRAIVRVQSSVRLDRYNEPEPDVVLLRPQADFYASRLPGPADILLIIEVAESSLGYDREVKAPLYAGSGVQEYWIVDLNTNQLVCCSDPADGAYRTLRHHRRGESLTPVELPGCSIGVNDLLGV